MAINTVCPSSLPYTHVCEGPDDMPSHLKASLIGSQLLIPISDGQLGLGPWQGIYLCEHRDRAVRRRLILTVFGDPKS
jgi:secondary thiamine-phosphate synthase enzyme